MLTGKLGAERILADRGVDTVDLIGDQGLAVGPFGILADVEGPGLAVFKNGRLGCLGVFNLGNKQVNTKLNTTISTLNRGPRGQKASFLAKS